jgi:hypothetical protein
MRSPVTPDKFDAVLSRAPAAGRQPLWLYAVVIIGALGVLSLGYSALFSPATMLTSGEQLSGAARTWAHYTAPYDIALGAALLRPPAAAHSAGPRGRLDIVRGPVRWCSAGFPARRG